MNERIPMKNDLPPDLSRAEFDILRVLWKNGRQSVREVHDIVHETYGWAYSTTKTMMDRMVKKKLLKVEKLRNLHLYRAAVTPSQAKKSEIARTLKRAFNDSLTPMMQFLIENDQMSDEDYTELEKLIKQKKHKKK